MIQIIKIVLGNLGSGKTAWSVREMALNIDRKITYSNIMTNLKNQLDLEADMIIKKDLIGYKKNKSGEDEGVYKYIMNKDFWRKTVKKKKGINIVLDEASNLIDSRKSMSNVNIVFTQWLFMLRRVIGQSISGYGELTFITQLLDNIDIRARRLATNIIYTICHYLKSCESCGCSWKENSEMAEGYKICPMCKDYKIVKHSHVLECWHFPNINYYNMWYEFGQKTFYKHYYLDKIEDYFGNYDTLQWESLFEDYY